MFWGNEVEKTFSEDRTIRDGRFSFVLRSAPTVQKRSLLSTSAIVDMYEASSVEEIESFSYTDPFAPNGATMGRVLHFKNVNKEVSPISGIVETVRAKRIVARDKRNVFFSQDTLFMDFSEFVRLPRTIVSGSALSLWMFIDALFFNRPEGWSNGDIIGTGIVFSVLIFILVGAASAGISAIERKVHKKLQNSSTPKMITVGEKSRNDEFYFVGGYSKILTLVDRGEADVSTLVRRKLSLDEKDHAEVNDWAFQVNVLLKLRSKLSGGFPTHLIPLMRDDVVILIEDFQAQLARLEAEALQRKQEEAELIAQGRSVSGITEAAQNDSKAALEGASSFLKSLSADDLVASKD